MSLYGYPVSVDGDYEEPLHRFLWLLKWFLVIPHWVVLGLLSIPQILSYPAAWLAIIILGRYPRLLWDYHVGLMRWKWRLNYYAYHMGATDQYPPFSMAERDYPASIAIEYPESSSRMTALFRWILIIPQAIISSLIGDLVGILVFISLVALLFTGRYPEALFAVNLGFNRWRYRVGAYGALLRDEYPPFSIDP